MKFIGRLFKFLVFGVGAIALLVVVLLIVNPFLEADNKAQPVRMAGYFKTDESHRVQTYWVKSHVTNEELLEHARSTPFTYPNLAAVWYYDEDATVPAITKAPNMDAVWARIASNQFSRPRFVYWRIVDHERFHDCTTTEGRALDVCKRAF